MKKKAGFLNVGITIYEPMDYYDDDGEIKLSSEVKLYPSPSKFTVWFLNKDSYEYILDQDLLVLPKGNLVRRVMRVHPLSVAQLAPVFHQFLHFSYGREGIQERLDHRKQDNDCHESQHNPRQPDPEAFLSHLVSRLRSVVSAPAAGL